MSDSELIRVSSGAREFGRDDETLSKRTVEFFRALLEHASDAMFTAKDGRIVDSNIRASELFGYTTAEFLGMSPVELSPEAQPDGSRSEKQIGGLLTAAIDGEQQFFEWLHRKKDGETFESEVSLSRIDVEGDAYVHAIVRDVSARRRAEREVLRRAELEHLIADVSTRMLSCSSSEVDEEIEYALERAGKLAEVDRSYVFLISDDGDSIDNTHEWCEKGISAQKEHLQSLPTAAFSWWMKYLHAGETIRIPRVKDMPDEAATERHVLETQDIQSVIVLPMARAGQLVGFLGFDAVSKERNWDGSDAAILSTLANVIVSALERVWGRKKIEEKDERLELALQGADLAMWDLDLTTGGVFFNDRWAEMLGHEVENIPLHRDQWRELIHEEDLGRMESALEEHTSGGSAVLAGEFRVATAVGEWKWIRIRGRIVGRSEDGTPNRLAGTIQDIDETKRAEAEYRGLEEQLRQSQKMEVIGRLAGAVAHDFNNLLVPILTSAEFIIVEENLPDGVREDAMQVAEAARRAGALTKQLLSMSRKQVMTIGRVDLDGMVRESERMLSRLLSANIRWKNSLRASDEAIYADEGQIQQVLMNLVVNAVDAMPEGGELLVRTEVVDLNDEVALGIPGARAGQFAVLSVSDTGTGMGEDVVGQMFEPFYTTKQPGKGTGLGLSTVQGIVQQHDGFIDVDSRVGVGSTFDVYLPLSGDTSVDSRVSGPPLAPQQEAVILVVEDDVQVRMMERRILERSGHTVIEAPDAENAVVLIRDEGVHPHMLLTDVVLPGMDGLSLYEEVRELLPDIRVLFTSGYPGQDDDRMREIGSSHFIGKPFTPSSLSKAVDRALTDAV